MSAPWTKSRQEAAERRCAEAARRPWKAILWKPALSSGSVPAATIVAGEDIVAEIMSGPRGETPPRCEANANFLAEARQDIPDALSELRRLRKIVARQAKEINWLNMTHREGQAITMHASELMEGEQIAVEHERDGY